jgi:hypothetical protein
MGCAREEPEDARRSWKRVELPGFSVMLPAGKRVATSEAPSAGKHHLKLTGSFVDHWLRDTVIDGNVIVEWTSQASTREEWDSLFLPMLVASLNTTIPGSKVLKDEQIDDSRWMSIIGKHRVPLAVGVVRCDESFQVMITYAHSHLIEPQADDMREILRSVSCHVAAANRARILAVTRLPEKFGVVDSTEVQMFRSLDGEVVVLNFTSGDVQRDPGMYRTVIKALLGTVYEARIADSQMIAVPVPDGLHPGRASLLRVNLPAAGGITYVGAINCAPQRQSLMSIWSAPETSDALALERFGQVDCPGAASTPSPSFDSLVQAACRSGDQIACGIQAHPES